MAARRPGRRGRGRADGSPDAQTPPAAAAVDGCPANGVPFRLPPALCAAVLLLLLLLLMHLMHLQQLQPPPLLRGPAVGIITGSGASLSPGQPFTGTRMRLGWY